MTKCPKQDENLVACTCTYEPCSRKGRCCECVAYHRRTGDLPGCVFPKQAEATYDRSAAMFKRSVK